MASFIAPDLHKTARWRQGIPTMCLGKGGQFSHNPARKEDRMGRMKHGKASALGITQRTFKTSVWLKAEGVWVKARS